MSITIESGQGTRKDPNSIEVFEMDWDSQRLNPTVQIASSSWIVTAPANDSTPITTDQPSILAGNRKTQVRLSAGTLWKKYTVTNRIVTNETPAQTLDASFTVVIL